MTQIVALAKRLLLLNWRTTIPILRPKTEQTLKKSSFFIYILVKQLNVLYHSMLHTVTCKNTINKRKNKVIICWLNTLIYKSF